LGQRESCQPSVHAGLTITASYSGVSWAVNGGNKKVNLITDWPMTNVATSNSDKVPTRISYKNGKVHNWGNSVKSSEECFRWFKLLLDPKANKLANQAQAAKTSHNLLGKLNKKADDIAVDYLRLVWQYTKDDIARKQGDNWESIYKLRVVLTVPAIWSAAAKNRTLAIAKGAGLPDDISLVSEPEAAALAVLKEKNDEDASLQVGDTFVVCDAGGGTVVRKSLAIACVANMTRT
jgi:molecular chaperone DnaK (HSP70)